jgi:hypothetical protein
MGVGGAEGGGPSVLPGGGHIRSDCVRNDALAWAMAGPAERAPSRRGGTGARPGLGMGCGLGSGLGGGWAGGGCHLGGVKGLHCRERLRLRHGEQTGDHLPHWLHLSAGYVCN